MGIIIYNENYDRIQVTTHSTEEWTGSEAVEEQVRVYWEGLIAKTPNLWSGPATRLSSVHQAERALHLVTEVTDYKHHVGTRRNERREDRANPVYVSARIVTANNKQVFGRRANTERGNDEYNIAAGLVHPVLDAPDGIPSLGVALYREVFEEFGLIPESFMRVQPRMHFGMDSERHGSFLYDITLKLTDEEAERKFEAALKRGEDYGMKPEMDKLLFVDNTKVGIEDALGGPHTFRPLVRELLVYSADKELR